MTIYVDHIKELSDKTIREGSIVKSNRGMIGIIKKGFSDTLMGIVMKSGEENLNPLSIFDPCAKSLIPLIPISCTIKIKT